MTENTKTLLIVGGVLLVGYIAYTKLSPSTRGRPSSITAQGNGNSVPAGTATGTIGGIIAGVGSTYNSLDSTFNSLYDYFGGSSSNSSNG